MTNNQSNELRDELTLIVTRNGKAGRIPELLEEELDALEALIKDRERQARIDELSQMIEAQYPAETFKDPSLEMNEFLCKTPLVASYVLADRIAELKGDKS